MLRLNNVIEAQVEGYDPIQIQPMLRLNRRYTGCLCCLFKIQIQPMLRLNASGGATVNNGSEFKYNQC